MGGDRQWICEQNIQHFRALLAKAKGEVELRTLTELLNREEEALSQLRIAAEKAAPSREQ